MASDDLITERAELLGSLLLFIRVFYKIKTGREFEVITPMGRESHIITICRELTNVFYGHEQRLIINVPPGHYKSTILSYFVAWSMAHYPDSQFLYISYGLDIATKHTYTIKQIMELPTYQELFGVHIKRDSSAKDCFTTNHGGCVRAFGSGGSITGQDAGFPNAGRFSGAVLMDDMHKPDEVHSDTVRDGVISNYKETIIPRQRSPIVPFIFIGQRLHEADLPAFLIDKGDGHPWKTVILSALDVHDNVLNPSVKSRDDLIIMRDTSPYVFASQYQQNPIPAGGGIFKREWLEKNLLDEEPEFFATFITADTAETNKTYNDATAFSFWGLYKIKELGVEIDLIGIHWISAVEIWCEPKDLESEFRQFYSNCLYHKVQPKIAAIEKRSTGSTLLSVLGSFRGLQIIDIERTKASGSKTSRYYEIQPYIASGRLSMMRYAKHTQLCIDHMSKITANDTHRRDDLCDNAYDAIKIGLINTLIVKSSLHRNSTNNATQSIVNSFNHIQALREEAYGRR